MSSSTSTNSPKLSRKVPFFNPVETPKLSNISKESVKTFSKEFEKYKKTLIEYADTLKIPLVPQSYGASIEIEALEAICDLQLKCTVAEVTEEKLQAWLNTFKEIDPIKDIEDLDGAVRKDLKMPGPPMDMESRIFVLFATHKNILKKLGWPTLLTDYPKHSVRQIVAALRTETLRKKVERDLNLTNKDVAKDYFAFFDYVTEKAKESIEWLDEEPKTSLRSFSQTKKVEFSKNSNLQSNSEESNSRIRCFRCQGNHHMRFYPSVTQKEMEGYHRPQLNRKSKSASNYSNSISQSKLNSSSSPFSSSSSLITTSSSSYSVSGKPPPSRGSIKSLNTLQPGRIMGTINDTLELPVLMDFGADETCIGEHILKKIRDLGGNVMVKVIPPFALSVTFQKGNVIVNQAACLTLTIITMAGKLTMRNIPVSIIPDKSFDEFLIGRGVLEEIQLDPLTHLYEKEKENLDVDCSRATNCQGSRILSLMSESTHEDDSSLDDNLVSIGHDTDDSISNAFEKMVQQADDA